ncbi:MAG: hypothetical protein LUE19_07360 [Clostridiales bacterium]|nr:hypothetical protein [Clostridiales bacterium]
MRQASGAVGETVTFSGYDLDGENTWLISPLSREVRDRILAQTVSRNGLTGKLSFKRFIDIVTGRDDYHALLKWVYENQAGSTRKLSMGEIRNAFILVRMYRCSGGTDTTVPK